MAGKVNIQEQPGELKIRIRRSDRSEIPTVLFLMVWLVGWAFGELFALSTLFGAGTPVPVRIFMVVWVIPWTIGGGFAILSILNMLGGFESITAGRGLLRLTKSYVFFRTNRRYDVFRITELRKLNKNPLKYNIFNSGLIQFRYDGKEVRFGSGLSPKGKEDIFKALKGHRDFNEKNFLIT